MLMWKNIYAQKAAQWGKKAHAHGRTNSAIAQSGKRSKICAKFKQILEACTVIMPQKYVKKSTTGHWSQQQLERPKKS